VRRGKAASSDDTAEDKLGGWAAGDDAGVV
jgi:hypothetical protein